MTNLKLLLAISVLSFSGCGSTGSEPDAIVQGTVTVDGELAKRGTVRFYPVDSGPVAIAVINRDGTYALRVGRGDIHDANFSKIDSGEYVATVVVHAPSTMDEERPEMPPTPGPRLSGKRFAQKETSGLTFQVKSGMNICPIEVEGSASDPVEEEDSNAAEDEETDSESAESDTEAGDPSIETERDGEQTDSNGQKEEGGTRKVDDPDTETTS